MLGHDRYDVGNDMVCGWAGSLGGEDGIARTRQHTGGVYAGTGTGPKLYAAPGNTRVAQAPETVGLAGSTQPHTNMQPFAVINFFICAQAGIYPPRS